MRKRQRINKGKHSYYVVRDKFGRFKDWGNIVKSIKKDTKTKTKKKVRSRYGHLGDLKK